MKSIKLISYSILIIALYIVYELSFGIYNFKFDHINISLGNNPIFSTKEEVFDVKFDLVGSFTTPISFLGLGFHRLDINAIVIKNTYYPLLMGRVDTVLLPDLDGFIDLMNIDFKHMMIMPSLAHQDKRTITITIKGTNFNFLHETTSFIYSNGLVNGTSVNDIVTAMLQYYDVQLTMSWMPSFYLYNLGEFYPYFLPIPPIKFLLSSIMNPAYVLYKNTTASGMKTNNTLSKRHRRDRRRKPPPDSNNSSYLDERVLFMEDASTVTIEDYYDEIYDNAVRDIGYYANITKWENRWLSAFKKRFVLLSPYNSYTRSINITNFYENYKHSYNYKWDDIATDLFTQYTVRIDKLLQEFVINNIENELVLDGNMNLLNSIIGYLNVYSPYIEFNGYRAIDASTGTKALRTTIDSFTFDSRDIYGSCSHAKVVIKCLQSDGSSCSLLDIPIELVHQLYDHADLAVVVSTNGDNIIVKLLGINRITIGISLSHALTHSLTYLLMHYYLLTITYTIKV